jgi:hypothetical protein
MQLSLDSVNRVGFDYRFVLQTSRVSGLMFGETILRTALSGNKTDFYIARKLA